MGDYHYIGEIADSDTPYVRAWDDDQGIEIVVQGCGTCYLSNIEARKLLAWLNKRYVLDELADI